MSDVTKEKQRIKDLLNLQFCIVSAINEEIEWCLLGRESDIADRIKYIVDEKRVRGLEE